MGPYLQHFYDLRDTTAEREQLCRELLPDRLDVDRVRTVLDDVARMVARPEKVRQRNAWRLYTHLDEMLLILKQSPALESGISMMHCNDFRVDNDRLFMRGKHTRSDDLGLAGGASGPSFHESNVGNWVLCIIAHPPSQPHFRRGVRGKWAYAEPDDIRYRQNRHSFAHRTSRLRERLGR